MRRLFHAPYWFEGFVVANLIIADFVLHRIGYSAFQMMSNSFVLIGPAFLLQALAGIAIRAAIAKRRGDAAYLREIRSPLFITDCVRMIIFSVLYAHVYGWLKVAVPVLHPKLDDQLFWDFDRALFFGASPNIFFLDLFSNPLALRAIDWTYANVFMSSLVIAGVFFFSSPDRKLRIGFLNANATMWIIGAWLYVALPSIGPCYRFPSIWLPLASALPQTQYLQRLLMTNYQTFMHLTPGHPGHVSLLLGVAAWPSLHVAFAFLLFLWMRGVSRFWRIVFAIYTVILFVGSIVTGWHYLTDAVSGLVLAALCTAAFRWLPERLKTYAPAHGTTDHAR